MGGEELRAASKKKGGFFPVGRGNLTRVGQKPEEGRESSGNSFGSYKACE